MTTEKKEEKGQEKSQWVPPPHVARTLKHVEDAGPLPPKPADK